jgi:predicted nuclease of restriction endonuclease-like (RecB) superfamily
MSLLKPDYINTLNELKDKIRQARTRASFIVNTELLKLYWEIGTTILQQQEIQGWGAKTIETLSKDLKTEFPDFKGLSVRNLTYMRNFAEAYPLFVQAVPAQLQPVDLQNVEILQRLAAKLENPSPAILQQLVAQLPWGHHQLLLDKIKSNELRFFYMAKCIENGWSRNVLFAQIESELHKRSGNTISNFQQTLPPIHSDLAQQTFKNPYVFDFLSISEEMKERGLEKALIQHLKQFMLELGKGFAYIGNQKNLVVNGDDFLLDLLFYNYHLHCFVVFELKIGEFKPEYAGKLNFYVNTINAQLKSNEDKLTIGVLLCKTPNETVIKYSLQGVDAPIGVSDYRLANALPKQLKTEMPTVEELEAEIDREYEELKTPSQKRFESLKEKLAGLKQEEIKQTATTAILKDIFDNSLLPLFQALLKKMEDFKDMFVSNSYEWYGKNKTITDVNELAASWKDEEFLKSKMEFHFSYRLHGLKKAGTESFDTGIELNYRIDTYWYGFILVNYNNQQPFVKKLYHERLSKEDIELITDTVYSSVMENIESQIEQLKA